MGAIWKKLKSFWKNNLLKNLRKISAKLGGFLSTVAALFTPVWTFLMHLWLPAIFADFFIGVYIAGVALFAYAIMRIMKNGYENGNGKTTEL